MGFDKNTRFAMERVRENASSWGLLFCQECSIAEMQSWSDLMMLLKNNTVEIVPEVMNRDVGVSRSTTKIYHFQNHRYEQTSYYYIAFRC